LKYRQGQVLWTIVFQKNKGQKNAPMNKCCAEKMGAILPYRRGRILIRRSGESIFYNTLFLIAFHSMSFVYGQ